MAFDKPQSRNEAILQNMLGAGNVLEPPQSRIESLLQEILEAGGGGGGTDDYNDLKNQPQIGGNTLTGNKTASDLGLADSDTVDGILDGTNIDSFGDVETALEGKQDALTAGDYIDITNNKISVNRNIIPENTTYNIKHVSRYNAVVTKYINGVKQSENNYQYWGGTVWTIDDAFKLVCDRGNNAFAYQLLADTIDHTAGYYGILFDTNETSVGVEVDLIYPDEDTSGQKLIIKSEMDAALADKQDKSDNALRTTDKTIVGGINELKSGLTSLLNAFSSLGLSVVNGKVCQTYKTN